MQTFEMKMGVVRQWINKHSQDLIGLLLASLIPILFALTYIRNYAPVTEGWWHVYGLWILEGRIPYRDFELLVPPIFPWIISVAQLLGLEQFLTLRILGLLLLVGISVASYFLLKGTLNSAILGLVVATSMVYLQMGAAYISYDYVYFSIFFLLLTFVPAAWILRKTENCSNSTLFGASFLAGLFSALSFFTKQTHGLVAVFFGFIAISAALWLRRNNGALSTENSLKLTKNVLAFPLGFLSIFAIISSYLLMNGALQPAIQDLFFTASETKGGLTSSLFRWANSFFSLPGFISTFRAALPLITVSLLAFSWEKTNSNAVVVSKIKDLFQHPIFRVTTYVLLILLGIFIGLRFNSNIANYLGQLIYLPIILMILTLVISIIFRKMSPYWLPASLASLGLIWASGMSAGLGETAMFLGIALVTCFWLGRLFPQLFVLFLVVIISVATISIGLVSKNQVPYSWWGLNMSASSEANAPINGGLQGGLFTDQNTNKAITGVRFALEEVNKCPGEILAFPDIPVFQLDQNKTPPGRLATYWFDFSSQSAIEEELDRIRSLSPKAIVILNVPTFVWENHEMLFNSDKLLNQRILLESIQNKARQMSEVGKWPLGNDYSLSVFTKTCN